MVKLSFLMPAHNEEKIIKASLENLLHLPYKDYEVIIGLDGCTDRTESIVKDYCKKSKRFRYFSLNLRQGKPAVIDYIIKKARGDIIIINDADWIFTTNSRKDLEKFVRVFNDPSVGGIAEAFPVEWDKNKIKSGNLGYKMTAYSNFLWMKYQKNHFTNVSEYPNTLKEPTMFLTNVFRKSDYKRNISLGDDFERTYNIMKKGKQVVIFDNLNMPRMIASYNQVRISDIIKQKVRTAIARNQLKSSNVLAPSLIGYYVPVTFFIFKEGWKSGPGIGLLMSFWIAINIYATAISKFKNISTKKGWAMRARR